MKIRKFVHSCLFVEEQEKAILIDPGNYTAEEKALDVNELLKLDFLLLTHEHEDHMYIPLIKEIVEKFPQVSIISNASVVSLLSKEGIEAFNEGNEYIQMQEAPHEKLLGRAVPENVVFQVFGKLTHPGDSLQFTKTSEILALPIQAPWGSMVAAVERAVVLKPKWVIPIHDWHWSEKARNRLYGMAKDYLAEHDIEFASPESPIEI